MLDNDLMNNLEEDIKQLEIIINICKENNFNDSIIFALTSILVRKKEILAKLL